LIGVHILTNGLTCAALIFFINTVSQATKPDQSCEALLGYVFAIPNDLLIVEILFAFSMMIIYWLCYKYTVAGDEIRQHKVI